MPSRLTQNLSLLLSSLAVPGPQQGLHVYIMALSINSEGSLLTAILALIPEQFSSQSGLELRGKERQGCWPVASFQSLISIPSSNPSSG